MIVVLRPFASRLAFRLVGSIGEWNFGHLVNSEILSDAEGCENSAVVGTLLLAMRSADFVSHLYSGTSCAARDEFTSE